MVRQAPPPDREPDPTFEIGNANAGIQPWSAFYDVTEDVAELRFPQSVKVYDKMRHDDQMAALLLAFVLPIFGYRWYIEPNGARDETVEHVANDFGVPIEGQEPGPLGRSRDRFSHEDYLRHSLLKLSYGFSMFEQVYRLGDDEKLHIRKLAPRLPGSITQVQAAPDGGLEYIRQYPVKANPDPLGRVRGSNLLLGGNLIAPTIPVGRLVAHVNEKEGGNWYGRPWLRSLYRNWLIKDRLLRVDALKHERNGMGVPTGKTMPGVTKTNLDKLLSIVTKWKSGETVGAALPPGTDIELKGVQGSLPDTLASIRYHDEQMARRFIASVLQLGSTETGSRALGQTLVDVMGLAQESVAKGYAEVTNEHVIEDLVDLNYSIDESAPLLKFRPESDRALATTDLVALIQAKAITADDELEDYIRAEHDLPDRAADRPTEQVPSTESGQQPQEQNRIRVDGRSIARNAAKKQRKPSETEEQSKADFDAIHKAFENALTQLVNDWKDQVKGRQINELIATIAATAADDLEALASIQATPIGSELLTDSLQALTSSAAQQALDELVAQGAEMDLPDLAELNEQLARRASAVDVVMANSISQAAREAALREAGGSVTSIELATNVGEHLQGLGDTYLNDELGGALMRAQNGARRTVFGQVDGRYYASEIADLKTCENCLEVDGREYNTIDEADLDYDGGYRDCLGGYRCRGTVVCILNTEVAPSLQ